MSVWSQFLLQESASTEMELLTLFHDFSLSVILMILIFVSGISLSMIFNSMTSNYVIATMVEVIWTILPMVILIALASPSLRILYHIEEIDPYFTIKVTGHQWYWSYEMMDMDMEFDSYMLPEFKTGEFRLLDVDHRVVLPTMKGVRSMVTSSDVIHCWALPSVGIKVDAVPGRLNQVNFNMIRSGIFYGQCSEICGANHSFMPIVVESISPTTFLNWCSKICVGMKF